MDRLLALVGLIVTGAFLIVVASDVAYEPEDEEQDL